MAPSLVPSTPHHASPIEAASLAELARETRRRFDWDRILVLRDNATGEASPWKWIENARNFAIYTKTERRVQGVLAMGTVKASASEIMALLGATSTEEYAHKMAALHGCDYRDAAHLYDVHPHGSSSQRSSTISGDSPVKLSVRSLTFVKPSSKLLASHDTLCYLEAVYESPDKGCIEQMITTLRAQDVLPRENQHAASNTKYIRDDVVAAYRIDEQCEPSRPHEPTATESRRFASSRGASHSRSITGSRQRFTSRVHFYAEVPQSVSGPATERSSSVSSDKATKLRLLQVAKNCHRLSLLIRQRRLGVQALVGRTRFLPPTNTPCFCCSTHLLVAKLCRICGQGVCGDCSDKYERETAKGIEKVRVCDPCLDRVESADYSSIRDTSLAGPRIVKDLRSCDENDAEAELRYLLREALVEAKTPEHQASVMKVIRCVLDQDQDEIENITSSGPTTPQFVHLAPQNSIDELTHALDELHIEPVRDDEAVYRSNEDRTYRIDTREPETKSVNLPLPADEDDRLQAVAQVDIEQLHESVELSILCELAAAEMGCSMSAVTIFDSDTAHCVATNVESLQRARLPRENTLCAHTILDKTPNLVPHPEADIRYVDSIPVQTLGAKFYFGFPITDASDQNVGSFCVMHDASMEITETKYAAFKKLTETCNKVVRIHTEQRRHLSSVNSSSSNS